MEGLSIIEAKNRKAVSKKFSTDLSRLEAIAEVLSNELDVHNTADIRIIKLSAKIVTALNRLDP